MRVVDDHGCPVALREIADARQRCDRSVHGEHAVGHDEAGARVARLHEARFELDQVAVVVTQAPCFRQADAVDDARVIERIRDDRVLLVRQRLEQAAVRVEAGRVEDRILGAEEFGEAALQLAMDGLRAAYETHGSHSVPVAVEGRVGSGDDSRMVREPEVIVGAEVDDLAAVLEADHRILPRRDDALALEQPFARQFRGLRLEPPEQGLVHDFRRCASRGLYRPRLRRLV